MGSPQFITHSTLNRAEAQPFEVGNVQWIREPGVGNRAELSSGYWFISPEEAPDPMRIVSAADETIFIIEGRIRLQPEGAEAFELAAGSSAALNKSTVVTWTVLEPTVEFFVYS
ncbi:MAG: cupin domain-containing protein [Salinibacterium amurskyense]